jgi:MYXO-CTERM domain-containing protein
MMRAAPASGCHCDVGGRGGASLLPIVLALLLALRYRRRA